MNIKKIAAFLLALLIVTSVFGSVFAEPSPSPSPTPNGTEATLLPEEDIKPTFPIPRAKAALLYDLKGSRIIYESNKSERLYPASLTKIMTALIVLEKGNLKDTVTVSENSLSDITYLHSKLGLKAGEEISVESLMTALLVASANDAANVLAEYISGDIRTFVDLMNQRASEIGMSNTHFVNPHGFHDPDHFSSAYDILLVTKEALKYEKFKEIVKIKTVTIPPSNLSEERFISSTNHLISRYRNTFHQYKYATGIKTGSTDEAGYCLVSSAEKNGTVLISVLLGCENPDQNENAYSFVDSKNMFEYIFNNFKTVTLATTEDIVSDSKVYEAKDSTRVALSPSKNVSLLIPKDYDKEKLETKITLPDEIKAPIERGVTIGSAVYSYNGDTDDTKVSVTVDLVSANEVKRDHLLHFAHIIGKVLFSPFVLIPLIIILFLLVTNAYNQTKRRKSRRRRMKSQRPGNQPSYRKSSHTQRRRPTSSVSRKKEYDPWDKYR